MTERTRRRWVGAERNDKFVDEIEPDKYKGLADDKAFMKLIKFKRPDTLTIGQLKRIHSIAAHGVDIRNNIDLAIAGLYRNKACAIKMFNESEQIEFTRQIKLLERVRDVE
ncbi:hypothetical protein [Carnobacterium sp.]|uniref:hypothetical protein n=1 Tax=Carnobacterium sp. TaxID=48221 RepID=UPI00388FC0A4